MASASIFWTYFWTTYLIFGDLDHFGRDVREVGRRWLQNAAQPQEPWSFVMFLNNKNMLETPCPKFRDDKELLLHMRLFFSFCDNTRGAPVISFWTLGRVDIAQVRLDLVVIRRIASPDFHLTFCR